MSNPFPQSVVTRREALQAGLVSALGLGAFPMIGIAENRKPGDMSGHIDAHSHIWTRDVEKFPLKKGAKVEDLAPPSFTTEELIKEASAADVGRVVLIAHHTYYGFDNGYMIDAATRYPGKFAVTGMVDDLAPHPDVAMRKLLPQHVKAFRITSWVRKENWLDGEGMHAMWKCAADTRQAMACLINPEDLAPVDKMCAKHPDTPVVIDHFARIGVDGEIRDTDVKALCKLAKHKNTHLKVSAFYALGKKKPPYLDLVPMIRRCYEAFGPERLMWGSDSPYQIDKGHTYLDSISLVKERLDFLKDSDRAWLLGKTAEKVYFA